MEHKDMPRTKSVGDEEIILWIEELDDPVASASEVAEKFGYTRQGAHKRLEQMHEEGRIEKKTTGKSSVVYWVE